MFLSVSTNAIVHNYLDKLLVTVFALRRTQTKQSKAKIKQNDTDKQPITMTPAGFDMHLQNRKYLSYWTKALAPQLSVRRTRGWVAKLEYSRSSLRRGSIIGGSSVSLGIQLGSGEKVSNKMNARITGFVLDRYMHQIPPQTCMPDVAATLVLWGTRRN